MSILKMTDLILKDKTLLIREDFNVPLDENGKITSQARIDAALPTIEYARAHGAKILLMSHLGRPKEGLYDERYSLKPVAEKLSSLLKQNVTLLKDWIHGINIEPGEIALCENVRFLKGEEQNDTQLSQQLAALADIFVMDAFGVAHRKQASTYGVAEYAKIACAGPLLVAELEALGRALENPTAPVVAIIGGSKVSTKFKLLHALAERADYVIVGGGIANTFLAAKNYPVGLSLYEPDWIVEAKTLLATYEECKFPLPRDVIVADELSTRAKTYVKNIQDVEANDHIFDIGPKTQHDFREILLKAKTIIWNGPVGVFEVEPFSHGTEIIAKSIAESTAFSLAGGGDTIAAIEKYDVSENISYISTGGGAFLEYLEGIKLPAVAILEQRFKS